MTTDPNSNPNPNPNPNPPTQTPITYLAICPGFHPQELTDRAVAGLDLPTSIQPIVIPTDRLLPCDPLGIDRYLTNYFATQVQQDHTRINLSFLGFSAGTVGALGAAWLWRDRARLGAILLCDGWGVPVLPVSPTFSTWGGLGDVAASKASVKPTIYRLSHDRWTHDTWSRMGITTPSFIAQPEVEHLTLWSELDRVQGLVVDRDGQAIEPGHTSSAKDYIRQVLGAG